MKNILPAILDTVFFVGGAILLSFDLFHISFYTLRMAGLPAPYSDESYPVAITGYYYYKEEYILGITIGVALIIFGFLVRSWRKQKARLQ